MSSRAATEAELQDFALLEEIICDDNQDNLYKFFTMQQKKIRTITPIVAFDWACQVKAKKIINALATEQYFEEYRNRFLVRTVLSNHFEPARLLLDNGAHANFKCPLLNDSVLHLALMRCNFSLAQLLFEYGADVNEQNAVYNEWYRSGKSLLGTFIGFNKLSTVKWLLERGANPNLPSAGGQTPLTQTQDFNMCKLLCGFGADPNRADTIGAPLFIISDHLDIGVALVLAGADINLIHSIRGYTPLHLAAGYNKLDSVCYLLAIGADKTKADEEKSFPLIGQSNAGQIKKL